MQESQIDAKLAQRIALAKREWELSVDTISDGLALFEATTLVIRRVNWPFARFFNSSPKKMVGVDIHKILCSCLNHECQLRNILQTRSENSLEVRCEDTDRYWRLVVHPISALSGSRVHFHNNVAVMRDVTDERSLQHRVIEAEKNALLVEVTEHLIERISPSVKSIRGDLNKISGHLVALREILWSFQGLNKVNDGEKNSRGYPELAYKELINALRQSQEELDRISEVIGCLDELEVSTGHVNRQEISQIINSIQTIK